MNTKEITNFKRIEQKYVLTLAQKQELLEKFSHELIPDSYGVDGKYALESLYFDTKDFKFYREKILSPSDKHVKLRIRRYVVENEVFSMNSPVFIEIKEKVEGTTLKRRVKMKYKDAMKLIGRGIIPNHKKKDAEIIEEIYKLSQENSLTPKAITRYNRQAFFGKEGNNDLRMTFDTQVLFQRENLKLNGAASQGNIVEEDMSILEVKAYGELPNWIAAYFEEHQILPQKMSKYAQAIEKSEQSFAENLKALALEKKQARKESELQRNILLTHARQLTLAA